MTKRITKVWIEEGCIPACGCADACPSIFRYPTDDEYSKRHYSSLVLGSCRVDGITSRNEIEKSPLLEGLGVNFYDGIIEAADGCPVEVIKFETED